MKKIILIFMFVLSFISLSAQSEYDMEKEYTLTEIDAIIAETQYDTALQLLNTYIKKHPERFDDAQKRIRSIMRNRDRYIQLADYLLDIMENDPENNKKKLDIIAELESLEKHPSEDHLAFIRQAKVAAQFTYYRAIFNRIMTQGRELILAEQYSPAVDLFITGFDLYQQDFFDQTSDDSIVQQTHIALHTVQQAAPSFKGIPQSLRSAVDIFVADVVTGDVAKSQKSFANVQNQFSVLASLRNGVAVSGTSFESLFQQLKTSDPTLMDASFLPFASRFTLGRKDDVNTGVLGGIDALWNNEVERMKTAVLNQLLQESELFTRLYIPDDLAEGHLRFTADSVAKLRSFLQLGQSVNDLYALRVPAGRPADTFFGKNYQEGLYYVAQLIDNLFTQMGDVQQFLLTVQQEPQELHSANQVGPKLQAISLYDTLVDNASNRLHAAWFLSYQQHIAHEKALGVPELAVPGKNIYDGHPEWVALDSMYTEFMHNAIDLVQQRIFASLVQLATYFTTDSDTVVQKYQQGITDIQTLLAESQPTKALNRIQQLQQSFPTDRATISTYEKTLEQKQIHYADLQPAYNHIISCGQTLDTLTLRLTVLQSDAQDRQQKAIIAKNEGELRYQQALQMLKNENFEGARTNLQRSRLKFNESLTYENTQEVQQRSDALLLDLGSAIAKAENRIVVVEVRQLKNQAKAEYYNANFDKAQALLLQAKSRWELTNTEEDIEIANLMALITTALTMKSGRVILPTAPLYPEMSQILSIAHQYYDQGNDLMEQGQTEKAKKILQLAKEKIHELQLVYPLNQEAGILSLRIDQLIDKKNFDALFADKIQVAKTQYKRPETQQLAYTSLLDLYEINPQYPGLKQTIYDIEIDLGIRQKPVEKTSVEKAATLVTQAKKLIKTAKGNTKTLQEAVQLLDQAITLNPDANEAMTIKDQIQLEIGGNAAVVLTAADERQYQLAIQELQKNNIIGANSIVEQLLQSPSNKRSAKILELQKKVKALL